MQCTDLKVEMNKHKNILEMQKGVDMKMDKCFNDEIISVERWK